MLDKSLEACARAAHEVNRAWCLYLGDNTQVHWEEAPEWQKTSTVNGVKGIIDGNTPEDSHESWLKEKEDTGWKYGPIKDPYKKEHPCFVPYEELPPEQQMKDDMFYTTVLLLSDCISAYSAL